jgi:hypothetical protein
MAETDIADLRALGAAFFIAIGELIHRLWALLRTPERCALPLVALAGTGPWQQSSFRAGADRIAAHHDRDVLARHCDHGTRVG